MWKKTIDKWSHCVSLMFYTACKLSKRHQTGSCCTTQSRTDPQHTTPCSQEHGKKKIDAPRGAVEGKWGVKRSYPNIITEDTKSLQPQSGGLKETISPHMLFPPQIHIAHLWEAPNFSLVRWAMVENNGTLLCVITWAAIGWSDTQKADQHHKYH